MSGTGISSAFWLGLQQPNLQMCEIIELTTTVQTHRWVTSNKSLVSSGFVYDPFPGGSTNGIEESLDLGTTNIDFTIANTGSIPAELTKTHVLDQADIVVFRVFPGSPDLGRMELFRGKLGDYSYDSDQIAGTARDLMASGQLWPYYTYQNQCVWRFGSTGCGFNTASITLTGTLSVGSSSRIQLFVTSGTISASFAADTLKFGKLTITTGANSGQQRSVFSNTGDLIKMSHTLPFSLEPGGVSFSVFPGCRKRLDEDCGSKYNNSSAYLGFKWIPKEVLG